MHYDPYISCWDRPPTSNNGLPAGYSQSSYPNNLLLCSAAHGSLYGNVGCFCTSSGATVVCRQALADSVLWSAVVTWNDDDDDDVESYTFPNYCMISCECLTESEAQAEHQGNINWYDPAYEHLVSMGSLTSSNPSEAPSDIESASDDDTASSILRGGDVNQTGHQAGEKSPYQGVHTPQVAHDQCGNPCTSNRDCSVGQNQSCICSTQSEQYQPGTGTIAFVAACIISLSGKRAESKPCPCNSTYVSHTCCRSEDGLVWEPEEFKLGELLTTKV